MLVIEMTMIGKTISHYKILEKLGEGGMGIVYKAEDLRLKRKVAIKFLPRYISSSEEERKRFETEAQAAASLNHPNISTIYSVEEFDDEAFIVMEYIDGMELSKKIKDGPIPANEVIKIAVRIAKGLQAAHNKGIVHRDIKSSNIMISKEGKIKLMDFGLAKVKDAPQITKIGNTLGTTAYMSPEQIMGGALDQRSDIWSFGIVLYEMLTGELPFKGEYEQSILYSIVNENVSYPSGIDLHFKNILNRMLDRKKESRFENAEQIIAELNKINLSQSRTSYQPSIAILPFSDLSSQHDQEYLCEGIAEEILNAVGKIQGLRVLSRTSSFMFRNKNFDIREIGQKLKVDSILEGSVRKAGDRLRINVQLINIEDGFQLWSDRYDRRLEDIFEVQDDIAGNVVSALKGVFTLAEKEKIRRPETSIEAYEQFLKGRYYFSILNFPKAQTAFEEAIRLDPDYAPAYAWLANVLAWRYEWLGHNEQNLSDADNYSRKALELSETLTESHISRALVLRMKGNFQEAENEIERALEIEPNSYDAYYFFARMCFSKGDNKRAAEYFYKASEIRKDDFQSLSLLTLVLRALGDDDAYKKATIEAIRRAERQIEVDPGNMRVLSLGAINLLNDGQTERAFEWQEKVLKLNPEEPSVLMNAACFYARAGMPSKALDFLEKFTSQGYGSRSWIEHDPDYESIRDNPRFKELVAKLK